jgi:hypothetical protein
MRWAPIPIEEFAKGQDYRQVAVFNDEIEAVAFRVRASVDSYEDEGLGPARGFCLKSDSGEYAYLEQSEMIGEPNLIAIAVNQRCANWEAQVESIAATIGAKGLRWIRAV